MKDDVRFGSKADICSAPTDVRFTPESDTHSGTHKESPTHRLFTSEWLPIYLGKSFGGPVSVPLVTAPDQQFGHRAYP
jgi:hypothetical protein